MISQVVRQRAGDGCQCLVQLVADLSDREPRPGGVPSEAVVMRSATQHRVQAAYLCGGRLRILGEAFDHLARQSPEVTEARECHRSAGRADPSATEPVAFEPPDEARPVADVIHRLTVLELEAVGELDEEI